MKSFLPFLSSFIVSCLFVSGQNTMPLWKTSRYTLYADRVVQDKFTAIARSATELVSDYKSGSNNFKPSMIPFKFSINGKDNEMVSGVDHHFNAYSENREIQTPLIKFGSQLPAKKDAKETFLKDGTKLKIKLDMGEVLSAI